MITDTDTPTQKATGEDESGDQLGNTTPEVETSEPPTGETAPDSPAQRAVATDAPVDGDEIREEALAAESDAVPAGDEPSTKGNEWEQAVVDIGQAVTADTSEDAFTPDKEIPLSEDATPAKPDRQTQATEMTLPEETDSVQNGEPVPAAGA